MRICYHCGRTTSGQPLFCNFCGHSYNIKLCPRLHSNHRRAEACSRCGSRDLSTPQMKVPFWFKPIMFLAGIIPGIALLFVSIFYVGYFTFRLFSDPSGLIIPMLLGLALALSWILWMSIPFVLVRLLIRMRKGK